MQILTDLSDIPYSNIDIGALKADKKAWREALDRFARPMAELGVSESQMWSLLQKDLQPIPPRELREGYYDNLHLQYWFSGAIDLLNLLKWTDHSSAVSRAPFKTLDLGCSTGRTIRHIKSHIPSAEIWGADLKLASTQWARQHLLESSRFFCNSALPILPFSDSSFDLITGFSVFTHIESFEDLWLLELRRILKPGGVLYLTLNTDSVWNDVRPGHVLHSNLHSSLEFSRTDFSRPMPKDRMVFHFSQTPGVYTETLFHSRNYIRSNWLPFFGRLNIHEKGHDIQDVVILWNQSK